MRNLKVKNHIWVVFIAINLFFFSFFLYATFKDVENKGESFTEGLTNFMNIGEFEDEDKNYIEYNEHQRKYKTDNYYEEKHKRNNPNDYEDEDFFYEDSNSPGTHWVDGYYRDDGTYVEGYERSNPDGDLSNNLNYNP